MRWSVWAGIVAVVLLVIVCFMPWVYIPSKQLLLSGVDTTGTNFGKPAYFHFIFAGAFLFFQFVPKVWAKRGNLLVGALNFGWALRNYFIISTCRMGECPEKKIAIFLLLVAAAIMLLASLFPHMKSPYVSHKIKND